MKNYSFINYFDLKDKKIAIEKMIQLGYLGPFDIHGIDLDDPSADKIIDIFDQNMKKEELPVCYFLFEEETVLTYFILILQNPEDETTWFGIDCREDLSNEQFYFLMKKEMEIYQAFHIDCMIPRINEEIKRMGLG